MPTLAIVGAGPGLGQSIAKIFGHNGFQVALVARNKNNLDGLVAQLMDLKIDAAGFPADVLDRQSLVDAFARIKERYGPIDVLEYSPKTTEYPLVPPLEVTHENLQPWVDFQIYGAITAANQVLPAMLERGGGTLLFTTGGSAVYPTPMMGNVGIAMAGLRNWAHTLHTALADKGIHVGHVSIATWIGSQPDNDADTIAQLYWEMYTKRDQVERVFPES